MPTIQLTATHRKASAIITLTQSFSASVEIQKAKPYARYVVPLPDNAVVCEFEMRCADGRDVVAVVQEREEAQRTYVKAYRSRVATGLIDHVAENGVYFLCTTILLTTRP